MSWNQEFSLGVHRTFIATRSPLCPVPMIPSPPSLSGVLPSSPLLPICHIPSPPAPPFSPPPLPAAASIFSSSLSSTSALKVSGSEKQGSSNSKHPIGILSLLPPTSPHRCCPKNPREVGKKERQRWIETQRDPSWWEVLGGDSSQRLGETCPPFPSPWFPLT